MNKIIKEEQVSDLMVEIATYIDEDVWEEVLAHLLELSKLSFIDGYKVGCLGKPKK